MSLVLAAEILPMALLGIPSGSVVERLGGRTTMLIADFARADHALDPAAARGGDAHLPDASRHRCAARHVHAALLRGAARRGCRNTVGENERLLAQGNSMIEGGTAFAALLGPALAGVLIPFLDAPNVLYVDAATFAISFLILLTLVPRKKRLRRPRSAAFSCVLSCETGCSGR